MYGSLLISTYVLISWVAMRTARPVKEDTIYKMSIHNNGAHRYASTQPYTVGEVKDFRTALLTSLFLFVTLFQ